MKITEGNRNIDADMALTSPKKTGETALIGVEKMSAADTYSTILSRAMTDSPFYRDLIKRSEKFGTFFPMFSLEYLVEEAPETATAADIYNVNISVTGDGGRTQVKNAYAGVRRFSDIKNIISQNLGARGLPEVYDRIFDSRLLRTSEQSSSRSETSETRSRETDVIQNERYIERVNRMGSEIKRLESSLHRSYEETRGICLSSEHEITRLKSSVERMGKVPADGIEAVEATGAVVGNAGPRESGEKRDQTAKTAENRLSARFSAAGAQGTLDPAKLRLVKPIIGATMAPINSRTEKMLRFSKTIMRTEQALPSSGASSGGASGASFNDAFGAAAPRDSFVYRDDYSQAQNPIALQSQERTVRQSNAAERSFGLFREIMTSGAIINGIERIAGAAVRSTERTMSGRTEKTVTNNNAGGYEKAASERTAATRSNSAVNGERTSDQNGAVYSNITNNTANYENKSLGNTINHAANSIANNTENHTVNSIANNTINPTTIISMTDDDQSIKNAEESRNPGEITQLNGAPEQKDTSNKSAAQFHTITNGANTEIFNRFPKNITAIDNTQITVTGQNEAADLNSEVVGQRFSHSGSLVHRDENAGEARTNDVFSLETADNAHDHTESAAGKSKIERGFFTKLTKLLYTRDNARIENTTNLTNGGKAFINPAALQSFRNFKLVSGAIGSGVINSGAINSGANGSVESHREAGSPDTNHTTADHPRLNRIEAGRSPFDRRNAERGISAALDRTGGELIFRNSEGESIVVSGKENSGEKKIYRLVAHFDKSAEKPSKSSDMRKIGGNQTKPEKNNASRQSPKDAARRNERVSSAVSRVSSDKSETAPGGSVKSTETSRKVENFNNLLMRAVRFAEISRSTEAVKTLKFINTVRGADIFNKTSKYSFSIHTNASPIGAMPSSAESKLIGGTSEYSYKSFGDSLSYLNIYAGSPPENEPSGSMLNVDLTSAAERKSVRVPASVNNLAAKSSANKTSGFAALSREKSKSSDNYGRKADSGSIINTNLFSKSSSDSFRTARTGVSPIAYNRSSVAAMDLTNVYDSSLNLSESFTRRLSEHNSFTLVRNDARPEAPASVMSSAERNASSASQPDSFHGAARPAELSYYTREAPTAAQTSSPQVPPSKASSEASTAMARASREGYKFKRGEAFASRIAQRGISQPYARPENGGAVSVWTAPQSMMSANSFQNVTNVNMPPAQTALRQRDNQQTQQGNGGAIRTVNENVRTGSGSARLSDIELNRMADRVYRIIETRLKTEKRRLGY